MAIQSSYTVSELQADGKRYVEEVHVTGAGVEHRFSWKCDGSADPQQVVAQRAADIELALSQSSPGVE